MQEILDTTSFKYLISDLTMLTIFLLIFLQIFSQSQGLTCSKCNYPCQPGAVETKVECDKFCYTWEKQNDENGANGTKAKGCTKDLKNVEHPKLLCEKTKRFTKGNEECTWCDDEDLCNQEPACRGCELTFKKTFSYKLLVKLLLLYIDIHPNDKTIRTNIQDIMLETENNIKCGCQELKLENIRFGKYLKIILLYQQAKLDLNVEGVPRPLGKYILDRERLCVCNVDLSKWEWYQLLDFVFDWATLHDIEVPMSNEKEEILEGIFNNYQSCQAEDIPAVKDMNLEKLMKLLIIGAQRLDYLVSGVPSIEDNCLIGLLVEEKEE